MNVEERLSKLESELEQLRAENEALAERVDDLEEHNAEQARQLAEANQRISELEERVETPEANVCSPPADEERTPLQQAVAAGESCTSSPTVKRAITLFENFREWATRVGDKYVLNSAEANTRRLLNAARDEKLRDWNQVYRVYEAMEELSNGRFEYIPEDRRGRKLLVLWPDADEAVNTESPTSSSAGATG